MNLFFEEKKIENKLFINTVGIIATRNYLCCNYCKKLDLFSRCVNLPILKL